jgi:recombination protein RecA
VGLTIKTVSASGSTTKTTMADVLAKLQKEHGEDIGSFGGKLVDAFRIPTGLFPLDLALAGGFPRGKISIIFGPESSSKTNIALLAIASHQRMFPDKLCVLFDVENGFDPVWAEKLGIVVDKLVVIKPSYGEQIVDMLESALYAEDCGIIVVDSIAAVLSTYEAENSAERVNVGGNTQLVGKLCRKAGLGLSEAAKKDRYPTVIFINQIRSKVGVIYGSPETMPGGNAPKFFASLIVRVYGKNEFDPEISKMMPVKKLVTFIVAKWKCPILSASGTFAMATMAHAGLKVGQCDDFNTVSEYLKGFGLFEKAEKGKGWKIMGDHYDTIKPFKTKLYTDHDFGQQVRGLIINNMIDGGNLLVESEDAKKEATP